MTKVSSLTAVSFVLFTYGTLVIVKLYNESVSPLFVCIVSIVCLGSKIKYALYFVDT